MNTPDFILVQEIKKDSQEAFRQIYDRYKVRVYSFASRYLSDFADNEEIVQEVFVKLWITRSRLKEELSLNNYLFTITKNTILHKKQKQINEQKYLEYLRIFHTMETLSTQKTVEYEEVKEKVEAAIEKLPPKRKEIFLMSRSESLTYKEIAEKLNLSVKTVEAHMRLALQDLRAELLHYL